MRGVRGWTQNVLERPVTEMMLVRSYLMEDKEVMMLDGTTGFMPGAAAIRLLASRQGVGADRILVFTGTQEIPSFKVFTKDGVQEELTAADYRVLSRSQADYEIRLTDYFVRCMREADEVNESAVG